MKNNKIAEIKQEIENNQYCIKMLENSDLLKVMLGDTERKQLIKTYFNKNIVLFYKLSQERANIGKSKNKNENFTEKIIANINNNNILKEQILLNISTIIDCKIPNVRLIKEYKSFNENILPEIINNIYKHKGRAYSIKNKLTANENVMDLLKQSSQLRKEYDQNISNFNNTLMELCAFIKNQKIKELYNLKQTKIHHDQRDIKFIERSNYINTLRYIHTSITNNNNNNNVESISACNKNNNQIDVVTSINNNRSVGVAKCNPEDTFDLEIGFCVAFARAVLGANYNSIIKDVKNNLIIKD